MLKSPFRSLSQSPVIMVALLALAASLLVSVPAAQAWYFYSPGDTVDDQGYKPDQPIPFSHKLHAGSLKMPCEYCHSAARKSHSAGIPPMNTCMGCHKIVRTESEWIKKLTDHFNKNDPIQWVKVHDLPDFVHFPHKRHIQAGMTCQECHGRVEEMEKVEMVAPLQMGWCISCHTQKNAPVACFTCHY